MVSREQKRERRKKRKTACLLTPPGSPQETNLGPILVHLRGHFVDFRRILEDSWIKVPDLILLFCHSPSSFFDTQLPHRLHTESTQKHKTHFTQSVATIVPACSGRRPWNEPCLWKTSRAHAYATKKGSTCADSRKCHNLSHTLVSPKKKRLYKSSLQGEDI